MDRWIPRRRKPRIKRIGARSVPKPVLNEMRRFSDDETTPTRAPGTSITWCANILAFAELSARADAAAAVGDVHAAITLAETTAIAMTRAGFGLSELERVPSLLGLRLRDTMRLCRCFPPDNWPAQAYALVGRDDLAMAQSAAGGGRGAGGAREDLLEGMSTRRPNPTTSASPSAVDTRVRLVPGDGAGDTEDSDLDLGNGGNHDDGSGGNGQGNTQGEQGGSGDGDATTAHDGMSHLARFIGPLLFARDLRLREVRFFAGKLVTHPDFAKLRERPRRRRERNGGPGGGGGAAAAAAVGFGASDRGARGWQGRVHVRHGAVPTD